MRATVEHKERRFPELDSMRGLAALVVVFHHFAYMFYPWALSASFLSVMLYPFIAGHESVMFFFVLSGFVLALPNLRGKRQCYPIFLCRRVLRIYGPYLAALGLAVGGCALWHNRIGTVGWAAGTWNASVRASSLLQPILMIGNYDYSQYNTAFWSLVYEMRISIIFPALFLIANRMKFFSLLIAVVLCTFAGVHDGNHQFLITFEYVGVFLIGIWTAKNATHISAAYDKLGNVWRGMLVALSLLLYFGWHWIAVGPLRHLGDMPIAVGATGLLILSLNSVPLGRFLRSSVPAFLGQISYSLYLVHGTVLFAMTAVLGNTLSHLTFFFLYISVAILLSWGFYRVVEYPFTVASRNVGKSSMAAIQVNT
jgi:peptidoglycan/LPS O-acetylase OafA/YrhL